MTCVVIGDESTFRSAGLFLQRERERFGEVASRPKLSQGQTLQKLLNVWDFKEQNKTALRSRSSK